MFRSFHPLSPLVAVAIIVLFCTSAEAFNLLSLVHLADDAEIRYRMTIKLLVDGSPVEGSVVQELRAHAELRTIPGTGGISMSGAGEALAIDIPGGRPIYFPLITARGGAIFDEIESACQLNSIAADPVQRLDVVRNFKGPCNLPERAWPLAVGFKDDADPTTATAILLSGERADRQRRVSIEAVTIERTEDPLSDQLPAGLPWAGRAQAITVYILRPNGKVLVGTNSSIFMRR